MQVQAVDLVEGEDVDQTNQVVLFGEIAADVQHQAAVLEVGPVGDDAVGHVEVSGVLPEAGQGGDGVLCALLVRGFDVDLPVQGYPVPAGDLLRVVNHVVGGEVLDVRDAFAGLHLLQAGDDVEDSCGDVVPCEGLHLFRREEVVRYLDGDGLSALLLEVESLRGAAPVHQGPALIGQDHFLAVRVGGGNHPVEGAAHVLDGPGSALLHRDGGAELAEP